MISVALMSATALTNGGADEVSRTRSGRRTRLAARGRAVRGRAARGWRGAYGRTGWSAKATLAAARQAGHPLHRRLGPRGLFPRLRGEKQSLRLVRRLGQLLEPLAVQLVTLGRREAKVQRNGRLKPDAASSVAEGWIVAPGEEKPFATAQLGPNHDLKVREYPIIELDLES